jgi:hypothetical protein
MADSADVSVKNAAELAMGLPPPILPKSSFKTQVSSYKTPTMAGNHF